MKPATDSTTAISNHEEHTLETIVTEAQGQLSGWFSFYQKHFPELSAAGFKEIETWKPDSLITTAGHDLTTFEAWLKPSPSGERLLDIYSYGRVLKLDKNGKVLDLSGEPDSEAAVLDTATNRRIRLLFCGTPCAFEDAYWHSEDLVVVAGLYNESKQVYHPTLWWVDVKTGKVRQLVFKEGKENFGGSYLREVVFGNEKR